MMWILEQQLKERQEMGMYDTVNISSALLPGSFKCRDYQTKDFICALAKLDIGKDRKLMVEVGDNEWEFENWTGEMDIYGVTANTGRTVEFRLKFKDGMLIGKGKRIL